MKKARFFLGLTAGTVALSVAQAGNTGLSLDVATSGIGLHLSRPITDSLNARVGVNYFSNYGFKKETEYVNYDLKLKLKTFDVLVDWFPTRSEFRLTSGLIYNRNKIDGIGLPKLDGNFEIQGQTYNFNQIGQVDGLIDFRSLAPYIGIGWGNPVANDRGWSITGDIGVLFQGSPKVTLGTSGCTLPGSVCPLLATALVPVIRAETDRLNDELKNYRAFPVIRLGIGYKF